MNSDISSVRHDIKNHLSVILGFAQLLAQKDKSDEELQHACTVIEERIQKIVTLLDEKLPHSPYP